MVIEIEREREREREKWLLSLLYNVSRDELPLFGRCFSIASRQST